MFSRIRARHILATVWLILTFSLAAWWLVFALQQIERLKSLEHDFAQRLVDQQRMVVFEGGFFLLFVLIGGIALFYFSFREERRRLEMQAFLSGFTHELKTSLASLRLQSEILMEEEPTSPKLVRILRELVRLEIQLENALLLARQDNNTLYPESISLTQIINQLTPLWPDLKINTAKDVYLLGDRRALESIFKNIIQNAYHHGEAKEIFFDAKISENLVNLEIQDNGQGFKGKVDQLGKAFFRHNGRSGSGLGIYLIKNLVKQMKGSVSFSPSTNGFRLSLKLPQGMI